MTDNFDDWPAAITAQIGATIGALRESQNMSVSRLSARTAELGYPMHRVAAITKIEAGERAISVPELMIVAAALNTAPLALLMPAGVEDPVEVLPGVTMNGAATLGWFTGATSATPTGVTLDRSTTSRLELVMRLNQINELLTIQRDNLHQALEGPKTLSMPDKLRERMGESAKHARALIGSLEAQRADIFELLDEHQGDSDGR
jgi:transcriptional regulator with XRE-family HTH domain